MNADQELLSSLHSLQRDAAAAKAAITAGADVNVKDVTTGNCALLLAIRYGMKGTVKLLLEKGAEVRVTNKDGVTPVIAMADKLRDVALLKTLISRGADLEAFVSRPNPPIGAWSALHLAVLFPKLDFAEALLAAGVSIDHKHPEEKVTPLAMLCRSATSAMSETEQLHAQWLLKRGADPLALDSSGWTPFYYAAATSNVDFFRHLMVKGARPPQGTLFAALQTHSNDVKLWDLLIELGENIEQRNDRGETPLLYAQSNWNADAVRYLIDQGADVLTKDANGRTALERALELKQEKIITILEKSVHRRNG